MLSLSYLELAVYSLGLAVVSISLGVGLSQWWQKPAVDPWARTSRDLDLDRYGSAMDGSLSRMRWLPVNNHEEEA